MVVFVPEVKGCRISGAAWWATPTRAVIALSDRYKKDDYFWFTFFHEAAHLLLHSKKETFVDDGKDGRHRGRSEPLGRGLPDSPRPCAELPARTTRTWRLRKEIGIAPGIVVGRMQHDEIWDYSQGHRLKRSVRIVET